jgi:hypothetical protein
VWLARLAHRHSSALQDKRGRFPGMPSVALAGGKGLLAASDVQVTWVFTDVEVSRAAKGCGRLAAAPARLCSACPCENAHPGASAVKQAGGLARRAAPSYGSGTRG